ncbi:MAG: type secretion system protein [Labilithrix sp.]|nr:type secretion system protein [Labilithrix sp.]
MLTHETTHASQVTIGYLDGTVRTGRLRHFDPSISDLSADLDRTGRVFIPAEQIAYIGFMRGKGEPPAVPAKGPMEMLKVHVAGGRSFAIEAVASTTSSNLGFRGYPTEKGSPFRQIYFYAHGVKAKERDVPLGEMLVDSGALARPSLIAGMQIQVANRGAPLGSILVEHGVAPGAVEQAAALQARRKLRIGQILVEAGLATQETIERALAEQRLRKGKRLGEVLVELGLVTENDLAVTLGKKFQIPVVDLDSYSIDPAAADLAPRDVIEKFGVLPVAMNGANLVVAIYDPLAIDALDTLRFHVKRKIDEVLVTPSQLARYVKRYLAAADQQSEAHQLDDLLRDLKADDVASAGAIEEEDDSGIVVSGKEADGGIVKVVNQIIIDAVRRGASDIHIEPNGKDSNVQIRLRVDGECSTYQEVPAAYRNQVLARIKIMAGLDISERRKPQDGKIRFRLGDRMTELRVATLPTVNGNEDAVLRILASSKPMPLDRMGLSERNLVELRRVIAQPYGLVLCVGPTGSGKTTTLHSALGAINTPDTKIWTAEDPVEITQAGLRQVQVNAKIGLTFASCMRSFLRADPDVIMVGEMRDHETASTAVEASLTGHLVLSTLHTNSAPETITRLLDMGLDPFSFADSLLAVLAQRLTRSLCKKCRVQEPGTETDFAEMLRGYDELTLAEQFGIVRESFLVWRAVGCEACESSGYKGRLALHELLVTDDAMKTDIGKRASVDTIRRGAIALGMTTLLQDGIAKAIAGQTDMKQVLAVCSK